MATVKRNTTIKLQDTGSIVGSGSRLESYWKDRGFEQFYTKFRKGVQLPTQFQTVDSVQKAIDIFKLNEIGFGNWCTQEDRFNYISALTISLYDINKVCKFPKNNVGLNGVVSFTFGARGVSAALAHFEPQTFIINTTRYKTGDTPKEVRFLYTGGTGCIAHEYGHALDAYFGIFKESNQQIAYLSGGRSVDTKFSFEPSPLRKKMNALLTAIIWEKPYSKHSRYYERLKANFENEYWFRRTEIFARSFEQYVQYKLAKAGIRNSFLTFTKYAPKSYMRESELQRVVPLFDDLIKSMAAKL